LGRFQGSLRKKATLTDGGPEGLPEVTYSIRVLRTMKKNERDGSEMGPKSGEKRARTVGCTNSIDRTHRYYLQHAVHKLKLTPRTYYWHLISKLSLCCPSSLESAPTKFLKTQYTP